MHARTHTHTHSLSFSLLTRQCGVDVSCGISLRMRKVVSNRSLTQFDVSGKDIYYLTKFSLCGREGSGPWGYELAPGSSRFLPDFSFILRLVPLMFAGRFPMLIRALAPRLGPRHLSLLVVQTRVENL